MTKPSISAAVLALLLSACSSSVIPINNHYMLTDPSDVTTSYLANNHVNVAVNLPDYLKTPYFTMLNDSHQVYYAQAHKWAEPLDKAIAKAVKLSWHDHVKNDALLKTKEEIVVDVDYLHVTQGGKVKFVGKLTIQKKAIQFNLERRLPADGYQVAVKEMNLIIKDMLTTL
jgi:uncharacterized lipoprotein YmbA